jgi:hypothetical protein
MKFELEFESDPWARWEEDGIAWDLIVRNTFVVANLIYNPWTSFSKCSYRLPYWWLGTIK